MFKLYSDLTKFGIVVFVLLTGLAGYATSFHIETAFSAIHLATFLGGLYFLSSGSLALNQAQEYKLDQKMNRTAKRPVASGRIKPAAAMILAGSMIFVGSNLLFETSSSAGWAGIISVLLYNGVYVYLWKPRWIFGAIPGAIPGALPVTIGYLANDPNFLNFDSIYLFLVLFMWQMPHFWVLAIKFADDYRAGGIPTLPAALGMHRALYHIGVWTIGYVALALSAPWFVHTSWIYLLLVMPFGFKVLQEFWRFYKSDGTERWFAFFMWTNLSVLVFIFVPVLDKWSFLVLPRV